MREERQRLILEGLPKGDVVSRNKTMIDKIVAGIQGLNTDDIVLKSDIMVLFNVSVTCSVRLPKNTKLRVYKEGKRVVIGYPLKDAFVIKVFHQQMITNTWYTAFRFIQNHFPNGEYTVEQARDYDGSRDKFEKEFKDYIMDFITKMELEVTCTLGDDAYKRYKERDYLPIVSIDFEKGEAYTVTSSYDSTETRGNTRTFLLTDISFILQTLRFNFPYGIVHAEMEGKNPYTGQKQIGDTF